MRPRLFLATLLLTLVTAAPAAAAPSLEPLKACYQSLGPAEAQRESMQLRGTGFTPLAILDVLVDGQPAEAGQADAFGDMRAAVKVPHQDDGERSFTVTVTERGNAANTVSATTLVSDLTVELRPKEARSSRRVRFRGRGFTAPATVFGHYLFVRPDGTRNLRRTVRLSRPAAPCGTFEVRRRQIPLRRPRTGLWILQVDQQREYQPDPASAKVEVEIRVSRTFRKP
jgi:hypothetical protein